MNSTLDYPPQQALSSRQSRDKHQNAIRTQDNRPVSNRSCGPFLKKPKMHKGKKLTYFPVIKNTNKRMPLKLIRIFYNYSSFLQFCKDSCRISVLCAHFLCNRHCLCVSNEKKSVLFYRWIFWLLQIWSSRCNRLKLVLEESDRQIKKITCTNLNIFEIWNKTWSSCLCHCHCHGVIFYALTGSRVKISPH